MKTAEHAYLVLARTEPAEERLSRTVEYLLETRHRASSVRVERLGTVDGMMPVTPAEDETHPSGLSLRVRGVFTANRIEFPRAGFDDEGWSRHLLSILGASDPQAVCHLVVFVEGS